LLNFKFDQIKSVITLKSGRNERNYSKLKIDNQRNKVAKKLEIENSSKANLIA